MVTRLQERDKCVVRESARCQCATAAKLSAGELR